MSPKVKKILLIAGAAVAGYVVYTKVIKKPAATPMKVIQVTPATQSALKTLLAAKVAGMGGVQEALGVEEALGVQESLGVRESLGSLGGSLFR